MKHNRVLPILTLAIILALLMIALPATPALAQSITLNPTSGTANTAVTVTGSGFTAYVGQLVYILFNHNYIASASVIAGGTFTASFTVPATYTTAMTVPVTVQHTVSAYDATKQIAMAYFDVVARQIVISPSSGYVGSTVTVSGSGFNASSSVTIYFDTISVGTATTNTAGSFSGATFTVPQSYRGTHTVKGSDASGDSPTVNFTTLQKITITPASGAVGDTVTINGTGFAASSTITFYFDTISVTAATTNTVGSFTNNTFAIPSTSRGSHTIKVQDASGNYATATFTVAHKITITPASGVSGTTVTVTGSGFSANKPITVKYNAVAVTTTPTAVSTDANGIFTASFTVPAGLAGTYSVEVTDGTYTASANFVSTTDATISQTTSEASPGYVGMELTITGSGFKPGVIVTITYTTEPVTLATVTADANGVFSAKVTIPPSAGGNHTITVTDGYTTKKFAFVMESNAPPAPPLLLPLVGEKAKSRTYFDWEDVNDPSRPVTYTLQIASDADFTTMVLEKTGLITSGHTLTKEEKLESTTTEAPYYWRVRAIDAASNESQWTTPWSFHVGISFPQWTIYLLFGLGALLFGVLGFWLGRRSAYSSLTW